MAKTVQIYYYNVYIIYSSRGLQQMNAYVVYMYYIHSLYYNNIKSFCFFYIYRLHINTLYIILKRLKVILVIRQIIYCMDIVKFDQMHNIKINI